MIEIDYKIDYYSKVKETLMVQLADFGIN